MAATSPEDDLVAVLYKEQLYVDCQEQRPH
jgi:hypothetical protein